MIRYLLSCCGSQSDCQDQVGHTMQKCVFEHMRTAKVWISLHICAVWSEPSLSTNRITEYYRMYHWRENAQIRPCTCAGWLLTFQFPTAIFLCRAFVFGDVLITTSARISSLTESSSGEGPDNLMEYSRWNRWSCFLEKPRSRTTTILAHWKWIYMHEQRTC